MAGSRRALHAQRECGLHHHPSDLDSVCRPHLSPATPLAIANAESRILQSFRPPHSAADGGSVPG